MIQRDFSTRKRYRQSAKERRPERYLFDKCQMRARQKGLAFDLTLDWCKEQFDKGCARTGVAFDLATGDYKKANPRSPSVDRIESSKGYTMDNCQVVCWIYNCAKGSWSHDDVMEMARNLVRRDL